MVDQVSEPRVLVTGGSCSACGEPMLGRSKWGDFPFVAKFSTVQGWDYDHHACGGERTVHITMEPVEVD